MFDTQCLFPKSVQIIIIIVQGGYSKQMYMKGAITNTNSSSNNKIGYEPQKKRYLTSSTAQMHQKEQKIYQNDLQNFLMKAYTI